MERMRFIERIQETSKSTSTWMVCSENDVHSDLDTESDQKDGSADNSKLVKEKHPKRRQSTQCEEKRILIVKCMNVLDKFAVIDTFAVHVSE